MAKFCEKLCLINTMDFIDFDADCEGIVYVLVEDNEENREILYKIGLTDEDTDRQYRLDKEYVK